MKEKHSNEIESQAVEEDKHVKKKSRFKSFISKSTGYRSSLGIIRDSLLTIKEQDKAPDYRPFMERVEAGEIDESRIPSSIRNLKITLYILMLIIMYTLYKLVSVHSILDGVYASSVLLMALIGFTRYSYSLWILKTREIIGLKEWLKRTATFPSNLIP